MSRRKAGKPGRIDRFGTHGEIVAATPAILAESGPAACIVLFLLWDRASVRLDGRTVGDTRVSALSRLTGMDRKTIRAALAYLTRAGWIEPAEDGRGFVVWHRRYGEQNECEQKNPGE